MTDHGKAVTVPCDGRTAQDTDLEIIRATETWQQAGAYYVRIQAMAKKHHIPLRQEFDGHDGPDTKYIVVTDKGFPIATARMFPEGSESMIIGRVVVLPEYRHRGIGTMVMDACENGQRKWAARKPLSKAGTTRWLFTKGWVTKSAARPWTEIHSAASEWRSCCEDEDEEEPVLMVE